MIATGARDPARVEFLQLLEARLTSFESVDCLQEAGKDDQPVKLIQSREISQAVVGE